MRSTPTRRLALVAAAASLSAGSLASSADATLINDCRLRVANAAVNRANTSQTAIDVCLKVAGYYQCLPGEEQAYKANAALQNAIVADSGPCEQALLEGADIHDIAPATCSGRPFYEADPPPSYNCDFAIESLGAWYSCLHCQANDLGDKLRFDLDLPFFPPESLDDRKCIRAASTASARATRAAVKDVLSCAKRSDNPPGDCQLDLSPEGRIAKGRLAIAKRISRCRDENGVAGQLGPGSAELCNTSVTSPSDLAECLGRNMACHACLQLTVALGTSQDCAAVSGDPDCGLNPQRPRGGSFFVANRGDDTVSFFDQDGEPAFGSLAASSFPTGPAPSAVAASEKANTVLVVNEGDDSVTTYRANTGEPVAGTLAESTVVVGAGPHQIIVETQRDFAYVSNTGDDTVTFLDARSGRYAFGTLGASTFPVGDGPSSLALEIDRSESLYVHNEGDDTITFLNTRTGMPTFGTLFDSTFPVGANSGAMAYRDDGTWFFGGSHYYPGSMMVADSVSGELRTFDLDTGAPAPVLEGETEMPLGPGIEWLTDRDELILAAAPATSQVFSWSDSRGLETVELDGVPTDIEFGREDGTAGATPGLWSSGPALVSLGDLDQVVMSPTYTQVANLGTSPSERSTIANNGYSAWIYRPDTAHFYAVHSVYGENLVPVSSEIVAIVESTLAVDQTIPAVAGTRAIEYAASTNTLFALKRNTVAPWDSGVTFFNATTGAPQLGTLEASTVDCGCDLIDRIELSDASNRLYLMCDGKVVYVNATTGACLGGDVGTTGAGGTYLSDLVASESDGALLVAYGGSPYSFSCSSTPNDAGGIYRLDLVTPTYAGADFAASFLADSGDPCGPNRIRVDGLGNVYARGGGLRKIDIATGTELFRRTGFSLFGFFELDVASGVLHLFHGSLHYRDPSDLDYLFTDYSDSHADFAFGALEIVYGSGDWLLAVNDDRIVRVKRSEPVFYDNTRGLGGKVVPTGDEPWAIGVMSTHFAY